MQPFSFICQQTDFPCCMLLYGDTCKYAARCEPIGPFRMSSPCCTIVLILICFFTLRIRKNVTSLYTNRGRQEMLLFLGFYFFAILLEIANVSAITSLLPKVVQILCVSLQLSLVSSSLLSLVVGFPIAALNVKNEHIVRAKTITFIICMLATALLTAGYFFVFNLKIFVAAFSIIFGFNGFLVFVYILMQFWRLRMEYTDFWAYGTLTIGFLFFALGVTSVCIGGYIVAFLSDRYLDTLFFFHVFTFSAIIMIHKYWLSVYNENFDGGIYVKVENLHSELIKSSKALGKKRSQ